VKLTKSRDGTSGTAFFTFENPDVFEGASGDITGMYMADEEGEMTTVRGRL
jgi:photosystem II protein|tara:strand:+ start:189 stop:341 length:153 start_codon:yes stop_codon:yes gene_type:complete